MFLLRTMDRNLTEVRMEVGFATLGTLSWTFTEIVGASPSDYRERSVSATFVPTCFATRWTRPSSFGEARPRPGD